jgi:hypothetical protein
MNAVAQQNHFIYIQTENKQPFYVRMADRLLSSSSAGYLVIPKLQDGNYEFGIGFPKNEWPLQKITVPVKNNDAGYILKNFESKGWGLFNMQTMDIIMSTGNSSSADSKNETNGDGFADVLADVVSSPSIKQKTSSKEIKEENKIPVTKSEPGESIKNTAEAEKVKTEKEQVKAAVKLFSVIDTSGRSIVYADTYDNKTDTIRIFIPYKAVAEMKEIIEKPIQPVETIKKETSKTEAKEVNKEEKKFLDIELPNPNSKIDSAVSNKQVSLNSDNKKEIIHANKEITDPQMENPPVIMINSNCKMSATEEDFLKLRKKMAAEKSDDEMIAVAKKAFRSKCYSTEQVSNLGVLFLKDEGRYNFFDSAYPRVSDTQNFSRLVTKLTDEYYITRFKAMIRH